MTEGRDDPILDVCLEEVLGGVRPPDLTARIMQAWAMRGGTPTSNQEVPPSATTHLADSLSSSTPSPSLPPIVPAASTTDPSNLMPPTVASGTSSVSGPRVSLKKGNEKNVGKEAGKHRPGNHPVGQPMRYYWVAAVALLLCVGVGGWLLLREQQPGPNHPTIAKTSPTDPSGNTPTGKVGPTPKDNDSSGQTGQGDQTGLAASSAGAKPLRTVPALPDAKVIAMLNGSLRQSWQDAHVVPALPAAAPVWCRRTHLRMLGRIPTVQELHSYLQDPPKDRRVALVNAMLTSDEFSRNQTTQWTNVLIGRPSEQNANGLVCRDGLQQYLFEAFKANTPFDQVVRELITATGSNKPGADDYNGAVNFVLAGNQSDKGGAAAKTCQIFLGKKLCHNPSAGQSTDPSTDDQPLQQKYWELEAFFSQAHIERNGDVARVVNRDFVGKNGNIDEAAVVYERSDSGMHSLAFPVFLDGTKLAHTGDVKRVDRRKELAQLVTRSDDFSRQVVNRTWSQIMGRGFTPLVHDLGSHNTPSPSKLLDQLAEQFIANGYNLRKLVRWIVLSDAYALSSQVADNGQSNDSLSANKPLFSHYYARAMQPEELYESLRILAGQPAENENYAEQETAKATWLARHTVNLKVGDGSELSIFDTSYPDQLKKIGGDLVRCATDATSKSSVLRSIISKKISRAKKIDLLFLATLARKPNEKESASIAKIFAGRDDEASVLKDVWWSLLNSSEFLSDH